MRLEAGPNLHTHESMYTEWGKDVELLLRILIHKLFSQKSCLHILFVIIKDRVLRDKISNFNIKSEAAIYNLNAGGFWCDLFPIF